MMPEDFDEFAALWAEAPDDAEQKELEALARQANRRGRLLQYGELALSLLIGGAIVLLLLWEPAPEAAMLGGVIVAALAWYSWKRHRLGNIALLIDRSGRAAFIESAVRAKEAELKRSYLGLAIILPATILTILFRFFGRGGSSLSELGSFVMNATSPARATAAALLLAVVVSYVLRSLARSRGELKRLREIRAEYEAEAERDDQVFP